MLSRRQFVQSILAFALLSKQLLQAKGFLSPNTFRVPPLELGERSGKDVYFDLNTQSGKSAILPDKLTPSSRQSLLLTVKYQFNKFIH